MIRLSNAGPYTGTGTTFDFGNTLLTVPSQYLGTPSNGYDVRGVVAWLNALGFPYAAYDATPQNPGNAKLIKYGNLYVYIPTNYVVAGNDSSSLYGLIAALTNGTYAPDTTQTTTNGGAPNGIPSGSSAISWFTQSNLISGIPNWGVVAGGLGAFIILKKLVK